MTKNSLLSMEELLNAITCDDDKSVKKWVIDDHITDNNVCIIASAAFSTNMKYVGSGAWKTVYSFLGNNSDWLSDLKILFPDYVAASEGISKILDNRDDNIPPKNEEELRKLVYNTYVLYYSCTAFATIVGSYTLNKATHEMYNIADMYNRKLITGIYM